MEEKWELHIQTVFVFYSSRKDKKLSYGGFKIYTQERKDRRQKLDTGIFLPQSNVVTRSSTDTTQIFTGGAAISSSENEKIPDKDTFYALYIVFYIRLPTQRIIMFDRRRQSLCRFSVLKNWMLLYRIFYTLGLHYWFFLCLISFNAHGIRKVHDNNNTHRLTGNNNTRYYYALCYTSRLRLIYSISTIGYCFRILSWMKWCLVKVSKQQMMVGIKRERNNVVGWINNRPWGWVSTEVLWIDNR